MKYKSLIVAVCLRICTIVVCLLLLPYCKTMPNGICSCFFLWLLYVLISFIGLVVLHFTATNCSEYSETSAMFACIISLCLSFIFAFIAIHLGHILFAGIVFLTSVIFVLLEYIKNINILRSLE